MPLILSMLVIYQLKYPTPFTNCMSNSDDDDDTDEYHMVVK